MDHLHLPPALIRPPGGNQAQAQAPSRSPARGNLNLAGFIGSTMHFLSYLLKLLGSDHPLSQTVFIRTLHVSTAKVLQSRNIMHSLPNVTGLLNYTCTQSCGVFFLYNYKAERLSVTSTPHPILIQIHRCTSGQPQHQKTHF